MTIEINKNLLILLLVIVIGFVIYNFGLLGAVLTASIIGNFVLVYLLNKSSNVTLELDEDLEYVYSIVESFNDSLEHLNSMHIYNEDENIVRMMKHSQSVINSLIDFQVKYSSQEIRVIDDREETSTTEA